MKDTPEFAPVLDLLPGMLEESHLESSNSHGGVEGAGKLLDVGVVDTAEGGRVGTVVYAAGRAGNGIGIGRIVERGYDAVATDGEEDEENIMGAPHAENVVFVPELKCQQGTVYEFLSPIRQICSARVHRTEGAEYKRSSHTLKSPYAFSEHANHPP